jgi:hypothetical protein
MSCGENPALRAWKISPNIVLNYLSYLVSAYLIKQVQRSDIFGKKFLKLERNIILKI